LREKKARGKRKLAAFSWTADAHEAFDGAPELDGALRAVARKKIIHYRQLYVYRPEPIAVMTVTVDTGRIIDDFSRLLFLHAHREASALSHELPEESDQFSNRLKSS